MSFDLDIWLHAFCMRQLTVFLIMPPPGSRLPLRASVAGLGGGISRRPSAHTACYISLIEKWRNVQCAVVESVR